VTAPAPARRAGLAFCLDVVTDDQGRVVAIEAGAPDDVLRALVAVGERLYTRPIAKQYDIVIAGVGKPKDVNLYQASRGPLEPWLFTLARNRAVESIRSGAADHGQPLTGGPR